MMRRFSMILFLSLFILLFIFACAPAEKETVNEGTDKTPAFTKVVDVYGLKIYATDNVQDEKLMHSANMLAEYLDNDEDGVMDNQLVYETLIAENMAIVMGKDEDELREIGWRNVPPGAAQSLYDYETRPGGAEQGVFDAAIEEIIHPITHIGYAKAYPEVFGTDPGSEIGNIMDEARGGQFLEVPDKYPDNAWYTYYDETCEYECQITEYIYWALTSILGAQDFPGRLERIQEEWRYNTKEKVMEGDPKIFSLLTDPQYGFATVLPDGQYRAKEFMIEKYTPEKE
jgi:hypothetical protein